MTNGLSPDEKLVVRSAWPQVAQTAEVPIYLAKNVYTKQAFLTYSSEGYTSANGLAVSDESLNGKAAVADEAYAPAVKQLTVIADNTTAGKGAPNVLQAAQASAGETEKVPLEALRLNGLYNFQIEFEEEEHPKEHLRDLNQNFFETTVTANGDDYCLSVVFPYWDQIDWALRKVDLLAASTTLQYDDLTAGIPYFIGIDKLNYDEHIPNYYAELALDGFPLTAFVKVKELLQSSINIDGQAFDISIDWIDMHELTNELARDYSRVTQVQVETIKNVSLKDELVFDIVLNVTYDTPTAQTSSESLTLLSRVSFDPDQGFPNQTGQLHTALTTFFTVANTAIPTLTATPNPKLLPQPLAEQIELEKAVFHVLTQLPQPTSTNNLYVAYLEKINRVFELLYGANGIWEYLNQYRNIAEDTIGFTASRVQEIALFGNIVVAPGYNINKVLGEVYFKVDAFLHPLIKFHALEVMSEKGYAFDEIFNGPLLKHGFIEKEALKGLEDRTTIYTSDLMSLIMDVDGVEAIEGFNISNYIDDRLMGRNVLNCLDLSEYPNYKPRFSFDKSGMTISVDGQAQALALDKVLDWYNFNLQAVKAQQFDPNFGFQLTLPEGIDRSLDNYHSIQHDFPEYYGISAFGLDGEATAERKGQAKQLKGYLMHFEQILVNYLHQLARLPELFSFSDAANETYMQGPLYNVPDIAPVFYHLKQSNATWESFKADMDNAYQENIGAEEADEAWLNRRNRFLDHLIGRFAESFQAYGIQQMQRHQHLLNDVNGIGTYQQLQKQEMQRLVTDKRLFAQDYEQITNARSSAFNYLIPPAWGTQNISGYKHRLCRLLGIRTLGHEPIFGVLTPTTNAPDTDIEGMHVVEHILLRPRKTGDVLLDLDAPFDALNSGNKDSYSFVLTIVLPIEAGRFKNEAYRHFTEQLIRRETPAHILLNFRWMSSRCGQSFERAFKLWLENLHKFRPYYVNSRLDQNEQQDFDASVNSKEPLIRQLNSSCAIELTAINAVGIPFVSATNTISFAFSTTDVFSLRVNQSKGMLRIARLTDDNTWREVASGVAQEQHISLAEILPHEAPFKGLTQTLGQAGGSYRITYDYFGESIALYINTTKVTEALKLFITQNDQVQNLVDIGLERAIQTLGSDTLQVAPLGGTLTIQTSEDSRLIWEINNIQTPVKLQDIYDRFEKKPLRITYEHKDQSAVGELVFRGLTLGYFSEEVGGIDVEENKYVRISSQVKRLKIQGKPNGGSLTLTRVRGENRQPIVQLENENFYTLITDEIEWTTDTMVEVTYADAYENVTHYIVRNTDDTATPKLTLQEGERVLPNGVQFSSKDYTTPYQAHFEPLGGEAVLQKLERSGWVALDQAARIEESPIPLSIGEIAREWGIGEYQAVYTMDGAMVTHKFSILTDDQTTTKLTLQEGERILPEGIQFTSADYQKDIQIHFTPLGGDATIQFLRGSTWVSFNPVSRIEESSLPLSLESIGRDGGIGEYRVLYLVNGQELSFKFSLIEADQTGENLSSSNTKPEILEVHSMTGKVLPKEDDGSWELVFDHTAPDEQYYIVARPLGGDLKVEKAKDYLTWNQLNSDQVLLDKTMLENGIWKVEYTLNEQTLFGKLNVIDIDPSFGIVSATQTEGTKEWKVAFAPKHSTGTSYIWRVDDKFFSRSKTPTLPFDFNKAEAFKVMLTVHYKDFESSQTLTITEEMLMAFGNDLF